MDPQQSHERSDSIEDRRLLILAAVVIALVGFLFFARLGSRALWSSEFRWAEISREMVLNSDYFQPTINGKLYYDKPLGSYWMVVAASRLTGGVNETSSRIPCAIAGLLGVFLLMGIVRRLYNPRTAILAGFILATSYSFVFFSRHASADVETVTGLLAAILLFLRNEKRAGGWWVVGLWTIMAMTSLTKGLLGFALPIVVIGSYCCLSDGWREPGSALAKGPLLRRIRWLIDRNRWLFNWRSTVAIPVGAAIYLAPFWISGIQSGSEQGLYMVYRENILRFFEPFDHRGPIYLYTYVVFALMAPWSAMLPAAVAEAHCSVRSDSRLARGDRFALVFFWSILIFFTLSGSRRSYYILPILPAAAILIGRLLLGQGEVISRAARILLRLGYGVIAAVTVLGGIMLLPPRLILWGRLATLPAAPERLAFTILWLLAVGGVIFTLRRFSASRAALSTALMAYAVMVYVFLLAMPAAEAYRGEKPFSLEVKRTLGPEASNIVLFRTRGPVFYLDSPAPLPAYDRPEKLMSALRESGARWLITRRRDLKDITLPAKVVLAEASFPWEGRHERRNKDILVRIEPKSAR